MRSKVKWIAGLVAGFVMGVAFVVACSGSRRGGEGDGADGGFFDAGGDAHAQEGACGQWEVAALNLSGDSVGEVEGQPVYRVPAGWEPFALESPVYILRRCAD